MQLIQSYLEALTRDAIRTTPNGPFFFTGGEKNKKFSNSAMGINSLRDVPKQIAAFLDLPDAKGYTGHCFRRYFFAARYYNFAFLHAATKYVRIFGVLFLCRSATTQMANAGATENQLMYKFNWKNPKMAQRYMATSQPLLKRTASMLTGFPEQQSSAKVPKKDHNSNQSNQPSMLPEINEDKDFPDNDFFSSLCDDNEQENSRAAVKMLPKKDDEAKKESANGDNIAISMSGATFSNCTFYMCKK